MGSVPILVVPDTFNLQGDNPAICLADGGQVDTYKSRIENAGPSYHTEQDARALAQQLGVNAILVKQSIVWQRGDLHRWRRTLSPTPWNLISPDPNAEPG